MSIAAQIEALLFVAGQPLTVKKLAEQLSVEADAVAEALDELAERYRQGESGLTLLRQGNEVQLTTAPVCGEVVRKFLEDQETGELTRAALETLTVIAYRGPITRPELEQIRGVNCSIIIRNLLVRGLISEDVDEAKLQPVYQVTLDFLRYLGVSKVDELPDYQRLRDDEQLQAYLAQTGEQERRSVGTVVAHHDGEGREVTLEEVR